ncbi:helix-turn-helix transcriptional regulator [Symbiobacterium terraclitae]|uniref:helix-turn-helix transcriptional regulator n=1 Tax=Symbiobacterium terraclitae TaxID=557451 RepID=UPI0035B55D2C
MTNAEVAILSLVAEQPRHGYEIEAVIEERGMREWTEVGFSSIYYVLKKLEARGLVERTGADTGSRGPARVTYRATAAGHAALRAATLAALSVPQSGNSPFLLGLANLPVLSPDEVREALARYRAALEGKRRDLEARRSGAGPGAPFFVTAMFDRSLALIAAELEWLAAFESQYAREEDPAMAQPVSPEKVLYSARREPEIVEVPETWCLTLTGSGAPEGPAFQQAVEALYGLAYTLKFQLKGEGRDFKVPPLEGLWWVDRPEEFARTPREQWQWQLLIRMPDGLTEEKVSVARAQAAEKKKNPRIRDVRFERFAEGTAAQVLHVGPFSEEGPVIARLHAFIAEKGYRLRGRHHEVYLSDFRRTAPEKLKTILRQPVEPAT